jgi:hypothetical protein
MVALAVFVIVPKAALNKLPLLVEVPWLTVADVKVNPAGNESVTTTVLAEFGPRLVTLMVNVRLLVTFNGVGEADWAMTKSATPTAQLPQTLLLITNESMYQPVLAVLVSVAQRHRS